MCIRNGDDQGVKYAVLSTKGGGAIVALTSQALVIGKYNNDTNGTKNKNSKGHL